MIIAKFDVSVEEFSKIVPMDQVVEYWEETPSVPYSSHIRDITEGWQLVGNVRTWRAGDGPNVPGTYALVFNPYVESRDPFNSPYTICFGETTREGHHRIACHVGALKGNTTNMSDKYANHLHTINRQCGVSDITARLSDIDIFFRAHNESDEEWENDREHSVFMEKQCHALYYTIHNRFPPGNTRDLPSFYLIEQMSNFMEEKRKQSETIHL